MLAISLVLGSFILILFFMIGLLGGWVAREYIMNYINIPTLNALHPEFLDENGNLIPDQILAVRFENNYDNETDEEND
jgi:hypothetical protein